MYTCIHSVNEASMSDHRRQKIQELSRKLQRLRPPQPGAPAPEHAPPVSTAISGLEGLLPEGGLHPGMIVEWMAAGSASGAGTLAWKVVAAWQPRCSDDGKGVVVIDRRRRFYPPAVVPLGIDLERLLVVRPDSERDALWALEQSLRCPGVGIVIGRIEGVRAQEFRRLQLAAETGGAIGLLLRPARERAQTSWADVRLLIRPEGNPKSEIRNPKRTISRFEFRNSTFRRLHVELIHCRGRLGGGAVLLEIDDVTGNVRVASRLAAAAHPRQAAGA
jgi:hypothetical protein